MFNFFRKLFQPTKRFLTSEEKLEVRNRINEILETAKLGGPSHLKNAVISADNLIDKILKLRKVKGEAMGERLKNAASIYSRDTLNDLWNLHKLRNRIVHEEGEMLAFEIKPTLERIKAIIATL